MIFENRVREDKKSFYELIRSSVEEYDFYSGGQLEKIEQQLRNTQKIVMLIAGVLTEEQKIKIAEEMNYFKVGNNE